MKRGVERREEFANAVSVADLNEADADAPVFHAVIVRVLREHLNNCVFVFRLAIGEDEETLLLGGAVFEGGLKHLGEDRCEDGACAVNGLTLLPGRVEVFTCHVVHGLVVLAEERERDAVAVIRHDGFDGSAACVLQHIEPRRHGGGTGAFSADLFHHVVHRAGEVAAEADIGCTERGDCCDEDGCTGCFGCCHGIFVLLAYLLVNDRRLICYRT